MSKSHPVNNCFDSNHNWSCQKHSQGTGAWFAPLHPQEKQVWEGTIEKGWNYTCVDER